MKFLSTFYLVPLSPLSLLYALECLNLISASSCKREWESHLKLFLTCFTEGSMKNQGSIEMFNTTIVYLAH